MGGTGKFGPVRAMPGVSSMAPLTGTGSALPDLQQQDNDGCQMGQVPGESEHVHGVRRGG